MQPTFFASVADFRRWLMRHHASARELLVGFYKKASGRPSLTWAESVDEALCFGWIDGVRRTIDAESYSIRFTPRRKGSTWSNVNTRRAKELIRDGRMQPKGIEAFKARDPDKAAYLFERRSTPRLSAAGEARFRAHPDAWRFFEAQPAGYRRIALWWVVSAKLEATRDRRLHTLIEDSAAGRRIGLLRRKGQ